MHASPTQSNICVVTVLFQVLFLYAQKSFNARSLANSGFFAPPFMVSAVKISALSGMPLACWVLVPAPLIPEVALVLLPPQKDDLSSVPIVAIPKTSHIYMCICICDAFVYVVFN